VSLPILSPETLAAQLQHFVDGATGAVVPAIHPSTTYARDAKYALLSGLEYTRDDNPTQRAAETLLAKLEGGADAIVVSSGMAAATMLVRAVVGANQRLVVSRAMYHGLRTYLREQCPRLAIELVEVDATDHGALEAAVTKGTALVWIETPANPTWDVVDIEATAKIAHAAGARLAVDSTVATPVHTQPLSLGADWVMHSATKFLNGHSDVLAGALVTAKEDGAWASIRRLRHFEGNVLGPFEAWLLARGMRTLFVRVERASATAAMLAARLREHPAVEKVLYPGLPDHPNHDVAVRQMKNGFGAMLSILVRGGQAPALAVANGVEVFLRATSLGGVESLIEHRATVEAAGSLAPPGLLRLSIGLEHGEDLWRDLDTALENALR